VLAALSWLGMSRPLARASLWILVVAIVVHTAGLIARIWIQGRPPVTNLYSSAIFVGWGASILGAILERIFRSGIGSVTAAAMGFLTLLVAHHLSLDGDTMTMMQAVLDTNFWLATHVVVITLGYSSTYLAGFLGIVFIVRGVLTKGLSREETLNLSRMIYGIIAFATLFSFVGTILGGIWADQSWGRFWGWDPKENGALLIVLWNALVLHARWGGLARQRGIACLAVAGNIVTSWSWFGTNMLGVGLHAYGFIDSAVFWMLIFMVSQLAIIGLGSLPLNRWRSPGLASRA
jgi:ABC-type transport system involved in cytochrome c biogenesis permease subunit